MVKSKIPVMGHIGYTLQFKKRFKIEGDTKVKPLNFKRGENIEKAEPSQLF